MYDSRASLINSDYYLLEPGPGSIISGPEELVVALKSYYRVLTPTHPEGNARPGLEASLAASLAGKCPVQKASGWVVVPGSKGRHH